MCIRDSIDATQRADTRFYEEMQEMLQDTDLYQVEAVSYTHLDVYKRQVPASPSIYQ